jgi:hypothetical protein
MTGADSNIDVDRSGNDQGARRDVLDFLVTEEQLGIGYGVQTNHPGRYYEYPGDPLANEVGTPVSHTQPA